MECEAQSVERDPEMNQARQRDHTDAPTKPLVLSVMALTFFIAFTLIVARIVLPQPKVTPAPDTRLQAESPASGLTPLDGEMALWCYSSDSGNSSIWLIWADGTGRTRITDQGVSRPMWSPDGKRLAYTRDDLAWIVDADSRQSKTVKADHPISWLDWLPDGRLQIDREDKLSSDLVNLDTGENVEITGLYHAWSPDGLRVAYFMPEPSDIAIWIADKNGTAMHRVAWGGYGLTWSPDSKRLAFFGYRLNPSDSISGIFPTDIQIADATSGAVTTLAHGDDLLHLQAGSNREWSLDSMS